MSNLIAEPIREKGKPEERALWFPCFVNLFFISCFLRLLGSLFWFQCFSIPGPRFLAPQSSALASFRVIHNADVAVADWIPIEFKEVQIEIQIAVLKLRAFHWRISNRKNLQNEPDVDRLCGDRHTMWLTLCERVQHLGRACEFRLIILEQIEFGGSLRRNPQLELPTRPSELATKGREFVSLKSLEL